MHRFVWFAIGFAVSWGVWALIYVGAQQPYDVTDSLAADLRHKAPDWYRDARHRTVGDLVVIVPGDKPRASGIIYAKHASYPAVILRDDDADGRFNQIIIGDRSNRAVVIDDEEADGNFNSYDFVTGVGKSAILFTDTDLDGEFDHRIGPGRQHAMMVDGSWREVIDKDEKRFVRINGDLAELEYVDDTWRKKAADD